MCLQSLQGAHGLRIPYDASDSRTCSRGMASVTLQANPSRLTSNVKNLNDPFHLQKALHIQMWQNLSRAAPLVRSRLLAPCFGALCSLTDAHRLNSKIAQR